MGKSKTPSYILTLQLVIEKFQEDILNKRFEKCRRIYNSCLGEALRRYNHMRESKIYRQTCKLSKNDKQRNKMFNKINEQFGLTEYSLINYVTPLYNYFHIDANTGQKLASRAFKTVQKLMFHEADRVNFIKYDELYSVEGASNRQGIIYRDRIIKWQGLKMPVIIKNNDTYAQMAIQDKIKFCRLVKKEINGKIKWYIQLILQGIPPKKINKETGEIKGQIGIGNVGIDIGTQTIAISSKYDVKLLELAPNINNIDKEIKRIQRYMDRSKKSMNPNKFNKDGTIKKGNKDKWVYSNKYLKAKSRRKELYRKQTEIRKQDHYKLINWLLNLGDKFYVEKMNYKGLQARSKETTKNSKGKFNKKKRFGKSLANKAPSMFVTMLNNKLKYNKEQLYEINTIKCKCSQYNHFTDEYNKKELKDRWNNDIEIQRDMYSAFLIMNVTGKKLDKIDRELCFETYDNFKILHDKEINRLKELKTKGYKLISSMGI